ncbi:MAG: hypothetical protein JWN40_5238 [Phycisphaerales bacterium]|nr:hypothetical protein [Phycisphaerales bacterium]
MRLATTHPPAPRATTGSRAPTLANARQTPPTRPITRKSRRTNPPPPGATLPSRILQNEPTDIPAPSPAPQWTTPPHNPAHRRKTKPPHPANLTSPWLSGYVATWRFSPPLAQPAPRAPARNEANFSPAPPPRCDEMRQNATPQQNAEFHPPISTPPPPRSPPLRASVVNPPFASIRGSSLSSPPPRNR